MKRIAVVTSTRAEYGLLSPLIKKMMKTPEFDTRVVCTGMHLSPEFGLSWKEIEADSVPIDRKIEILLSSDTPVSISKSMGLAMMSFSEYFEEIKPDGIVLLGDRFEILAVCCAAMNARIPIFHIHGGEATEGLIDEAIRHSITKMSYLHFTSTYAYRKRVIQLGENPERVFCVGALGVENAINTDLMTLEELEKSIGAELGKNYAVGTFHPVTLENNSAEEQAKQLLAAIEDNKEIFFLFTKANADANGRVINDMLSEYEKKHANMLLIDSLGMKRYLSAIKHSRFVIGNSSSGLIEAPFFHVPTINIGDRQKGRIAGNTVVHCAPEKRSINEAIKKVENLSFREMIRDSVNPYGDGNTSDKILGVMIDHYKENKIDIKKKFYDIDFMV